MARDHVKEGAGKLLTDPCGGEVMPCLRIPRNRAVPGRRGTVRRRAPGQRAQDAAAVRALGARLKSFGSGFACVGGLEGPGQPEGGPLASRLCRTTRGAP